jgi:peptidoglycan LD-endopeptidase LytH
MLALALAGDVAHATSTPTPGTAATPRDRDAALPGPLRVPVAGVVPGELRDTFDQRRGDGRHEAIDIAAPRGTPVEAVADGRIVKLFRSVPGGLTVYQFSADERYVYYYAHLDRYAEGLREGATVQAGEVLGYVGTSGNAPANAPHLHFAIFRLGPERAWWKGTPINPYPLLTGSAVDHKR